MSAQTMLEIAGANPPVGTPKTAALIVIDAQEEYRDGALKLSGLAPALDNVARLIAHWREEGGTIIHFVHHGAPAGPMFDPDGAHVSIMPEVAPKEDEPVIVKHVPNAFGGTDLQDRLQTQGIEQLVLAGFMSHVCISTTARAGHELGYAVTIAEDAVTTRDLPGTDGNGAIVAAKLHRAEMAMLSDIFAHVTRTDAIVAA
ncbi:isochorismatase superfamily hydrolase [Salinisphaera shabanensis T35B1]|uniref:cysteine hydrolase family protein n=1 Tax=Salinisphaera shabanensis TaxID=180542 RepID=UPI00333F0FA4|tara:strand:+ start:302 stop:904 length:603 start_codon:yes stop_codon:yes gene_type:complete